MTRVACVRSQSVPEFIVCLLHHGDMNRSEILGCDVAKQFSKLLSKGLCNSARGVKDGWMTVEGECPDSVYSITEAGRAALRL